MKRLWRHRFRRGTLWLMLCLGLLAGLGLARATPGPGVIAIWACLPFLVMTLRHQKLPALVFLLIFGLACGWWRGGVYVNRFSSYEPLYYRAMTIQARAMNDAIYGKNSQLTFDANDVILASGQHLTGKIQLSGFGANAVFQGDDVTATGKLYPGYGPYQGRISFGKITVIAHHPTLVAQIRQRFTAGMQTALPEPLAPFAMGLLVGQRATLPAEVKQDLLMVGLTHIIAVSGYNLTIILQASRRLLGKRSKRLSTFLSLGLIAVFLLLAGASASIVRAAIVSMLSIFTSYYGRSFKPLTLITMAAAITAWANPVYLWSDLSWYLSFLAFFGVMVVAPLVQNRWPHRWHGTLIGGVALESVCAELMSLPFILYIFGQMSRVGLLANVLVVTLIPLAMLLSVIAGLAGMLVPALAGWLAWPATILLNYMLDVAHILAGLPRVFVDGIGLSLVQMLALYGCVIFLTAVLWYKKRPERSIITDTNVGSQQMVND